MSKAKDYSKLHKTFEYDKEKATLLAEAMTELSELKKREKYLEKLLTDNIDLKQFLWASNDGRITALHDLDDEHLENILAFLPRNGRDIPEPLQAEATGRGMEFDNSPKMLVDPFDDDDYEYDRFDD